MYRNNVNKKVLFLLSFSVLVFMVGIIYYINFENKKLINSKQAVERIESFEKRMVQKYNGNYEVVNSFEKQIASLKQAVLKNKDMNEEQLDEKLVQIEEGIESNG